MRGAPDQPDAARLLSVGRLVAAEAAARGALRAAPRNSRHAFDLAFAVLRQGRAAEAADELARALARQPADINLRMLHAFVLNYDPRATPRDVAGAHLRYGAAARALVGPPARVPPRARGGGRLRVGVVSADLYRHSVTYFLEPLMEHAPSDRIELVVLDSSGRADDVSRRLRVLAAEWHDCAALDHEALAHRGRDLGLDVALDLSGLTAGHRQLAFARRLAPVQVSCLGYPHASGVDTIDARAADAITDPPDAPNLCGERVLRLPRCFLGYRPPEDAPPVRPREHEGVVFGCFGNLAKINPPLLAAWARVLQGVPGSCLVLKNHSLGDAPLREMLPARLRAAGLDPARVELRPPAPDEPSHLAAYHDIDVALDTFPYAGTTTTCEALWMGVPVASWAGTSHASRVGLSLLTALGEPGWCAPDADAFVARAQGLAADGPALAVLRRSLRDRMAGSPVCAARDHGAAFWGAIEALASEITPG